ncbi:MAG: SET domain-containing protein-lysine N-methyltransferase [Verrucomicrobia bacterium]|nr:SET domain-containing protein-lysine N-methyltransferase [Verrucomicrobiota bacterium]
MSPMRLRMGTAVFFKSTFRFVATHSVGGRGARFYLGYGFSMPDVKEAWDKLKAEGFFTPHLRVKEAGAKGLGVFADQDIEAGKPIEFCHSIVMEHRNRYQHDPEFRRYSYWASCECEECKKHGSQAVLPLGNGCIYNSADQQDLANCAYKVIPSLRLVIFFATKPIQRGEEILTWWGQGYYDRYCKVSPSPEKKVADNKDSATSGSYPTSRTESSDPLPAETSEEAKGATSP